MAYPGSLLVERKFIASVGRHVDLTWRVEGTLVFAQQTRGRHGVRRLRVVGPLLDYAGIAPRWV